MALWVGAQGQVNTAKNAKKTQLVASPTEILKSKTKKTNI